MKTSHELAQQARQARTEECMLCLSEWAAKRASGKHHHETTLTMLKRRVQEIEASVYKAGRKALEEV